MAVKYAVASGLWSDHATWADSEDGTPGVDEPADGDSAVIQDGVSVQMDTDYSGITGLVGVTIQGSSGTPGMLYFKDGASGYLKLRTGGYTINGTSGTNKGRLLANSNGTWGGTSPLAFADKAVIECVGTSYIDCQYLDVALQATHPTNKFVSTYGTKYDFTASGSTVDTTNNTIDIGVTPPTAGTRVALRPAAGATLPGGLYEHVAYYVQSVSGNTFKLSYQNNTWCLADITSTGSGTISVFTAVGTGSTTVNVFEDVTSDTPWVTTTGHNLIAHVAHNEGGYNQQRMTLTTINATSMVISANPAATQLPGGRIYLRSRNVSIRAAFTTDIALFNYSNAASASGIFNCELVSTSGTGTTFYGYGVRDGAGHTFGGSYSGWTAFSYGGTGGHTISGLAVALGTVTSGANQTNITCTADAIFSGFANGLGGGTNHTFAGVFHGGNYPLISTYGVTISGDVYGCNSLIRASTSCTFSGNAYTIYQIFTASMNCLISGTVRGCSYGMASSGSRFTGTIEGAATACNGALGGVWSGTFRSCTVYFGPGNVNCLFTGTIDFSVGGGASGTYIARLGQTDVGMVDVVCRGANLPTFTDTHLYRNIPGCTSRYGRHGLFIEDHAGVLGAHRSYQNPGTVIRNTTILRTGGATSSLEVIPLSECKTAGERSALTTSQIKVFEWIELDVPASSQTKTVYIKGGETGELWTTYPTAAELFLEAEYLSDDDPITRTVATSTAVLTDNSTWTAFSVTFTPAAVSAVRYRLIFGAYTANAKIYVDNQLN